MAEPSVFNVLFAWKCSSTHHKLALEALRRLRCGHAEQWRDLFLSHAQTYLDGAKAPDDKFKDFKNHVLHVRDGFWGGAIVAAEKWYEQTRSALAAKKWSDAVYNAGVLSHYYSDPWMPFHTGQSEAEGAVHRAAEWSIACSYLELREIIEHDLGGFPDVTVPAGSDWLAQMLKQAATTANAHYQVCIEHYDLKRGTKNPPDGLDDELRHRIAQVLGSAVSGFARVLERCIIEAGVTPPSSNVTLLGVMSQLTVPIFWVTKKLKDTKERAVVEAIYKEYVATGKVIQALPPDEKQVRALHATEVLKKPLAELDAAPPQPVGQGHGTGYKRPPPKAKPTTMVAARTPENAPRTYLQPGDPVEKAPSIGPKTAAHLERAGVKMVGDLLMQPADALARRVNQKHIDAAEIAAWQSQSQLMCDVPGLRGHDAQLLVGCGVTTASALARQDASALLSKVTAFAKTSAGERLLRDSAPPDAAEVLSWITAAKASQKAIAA